MIMFHYSVKNKVIRQNPLMGVFGQFFPTGTYTGIGTSVLSLKHVMIRTRKKKL